MASLAREKGPESIGGRDGYYLAVYKEGKTVTIGTDSLGYYPLYWFRNNDVVMFATAPGLFTLYPDFEAKPSPLGIASVLMTMHVVGDQTVLEGVWRLPGGVVLQVKEDLTAGVKKSSKTFSPGRVHANLSAEDAVDAVHEAFTESIKVSTRVPANILLSGGMDSRLVAGAYRSVFQGDIDAVTFARVRDFETFCAGRVAGALSIRHLVKQGSYTTFPAEAVKRCWLERSSNSLANLSWDNGFRIFHELGRPVLTGLAGDAVMGASHVEWGFDGTSRTYSFDSLWRKLRKYGAPDELVERLLAPVAARDIVLEVQDKARKMYDAVEGEEWQKIWMFDLQNRQRLHVVPSAWRLSLMAWPLLPFYNLKLLELMSRIPYELQKGRALQKQLLIRHYKELARLPLDRNSANTRPLLRSFKGSALNRAYRLMDRFSSSTEDRRTYFREYDFNNEGWNLVRIAAEHSRMKLRLLLDHTAVDELLPPPGLPVHYEDAIVDAAKSKSLLGLALSLD